MSSFTIRLLALPFICLSAFAHAAVGPLVSGPEYGPGPIERECSWSKVSWFPKGSYTLSSDGVTLYLNPKFHPRTFDPETVDSVYPLKKIYEDRFRSFYMGASEDSFISLLAIWDETTLSLSLIDPDGFGAFSLNCERLYNE